MTPTPTDPLTPDASTTTISRRLRRAYAVLLVFAGAALLVGGVYLTTLGGSLYYALAGLVVAASGVLAWRSDRRAAWLYAVLLAGTIVWAVHEAGFDVWGLLPRLAAPLALGIPFLFAKLRGERPDSPLPRWAIPAGAVATVLLVAVAFRTGMAARPVDPLWQRGAAPGAPAALAQPLATLSGGDWPHYGNDAGGTRFSPLDQLKPDNVGGLALAWEADVGPAAPGPRGALQVTPIHVGGALFVCNAHNAVLSLDAETGRERWRFDMTGPVPPSGKPCRGVSYHRTPGATGACSERILATSQTPELFALDAATGRPCSGFGEGGRVRLLEGLGDVPVGYHYVSSAPQIVRGKIVFGGAIMDGQYWGEPSGVVRAFHAVTGRLVWAFDAGRPERRGAPPPGETYTPATPNSWAPISADETLGLVYLPMGNATPDFYGAQRRPFDDDLASAVIALDAETGTLRWRFQTLHHDIWDYDVPSQPTLVDLPTPSGMRRALVQPTKRGEVFVLDRETGHPIKEVTELPVPQGGIAPGERLSPTQPFSTGMPSFRGPTVREADMWGLTPIDQMVCRILFRQTRYEGTLTPPTPGRPILLAPGYGGGINWGSVSIDVDRGILMANSLRVPGRVELIPRAEADARGFARFDGSKGQGSPRGAGEGTPYASTVMPFLSPLGMPCSAPPWGLLTAVDLVSGQTIWSQPLGTSRDSGPFGIATHLPLTVGTPAGGGSVTTRGGLVFIGASVDSTFRAFETATGEELWSARLPASGMATPMTYRSPASGRQFVVIAAGGRPGITKRLSTRIVAYALPR